MIVSFEIIDNKELEALQSKILANKRETEEENDVWMSDTDKLDDYIFDSIADFMTRRASKDINYLRESNIWEYQVCTNDREELYML